MAKNKLFITNIIDDKPTFLRLREYLDNKGYVIRCAYLDEEDSDNKIRVAFLRSDAVIIIASAKSLSLPNFYEGLNSVKKNFNNRPLIYVILGNSLDDVFNSVYQDDNVSDDTVIKADDFKQELINNCILSNGMDDFINVYNKLKEYNLLPDEIKSLHEPVNDNTKQVVEVKPQPVLKVEKTDEQKIKEKALNDLEALDKKIDEKLQKEEEKKRKLQEEREAKKKEQEAINQNEPKEEIKEEIKPEVKEEVKEEKKEVKPEPIVLKKVEIKKEILIDNQDILKKALAKYNSEEFSSAYKLFKETAGNPIAEEYLGYMAMTATGCDKNLDDAFKWYKMAVDNGNEHAKCGLADCYYYGYGTEKNDELALKYYEETTDRDEYVVLHIANIYYYSDKLQNYNKAFNLYKQIYKCNIPQVNYNLGNMYYDGLVEEVNYELAYKEYQKASELSYAPAINDLGYMTLNGISVEENQAEAFRLFSLAAEYDLADAYKNLGDCYIEGIGCKQDPKKALQSYRKAANLGSSEGAYEVGHLFDLGDDVDISEAEAIKWYETASKLGNAKAQAELARHYYFGYGVKRDNQIAFDYYKKSAEGGYAPAMFELARCYHNGTGTEYSEENALIWYQKSAELDNIDALLEMGKIYENGYTVTQDIEKAFKCYERANELGNAKGLLSMAKCYLYGIGVEKNVTMAFETYKKAADTKLPEAQALFGDCFFNGTGTLQNYREAVKYYKIGMRGKDHHAYYAYGRCLELGVGGVLRNMKEALKNYQEAADLGDDDAAYELGDYYTNTNNKDYDLELGFTNFEDAANRNYTPAIVRLAICYFNGIGIEPDKDYAHDLGIKAMNLGNVDAKEFLKNYFNEEY